MSNLSPGEPCSAPGCANNLSHPCPVCGRYAAGRLDGPLPEASFRIAQGYSDNPIVSRALFQKDRLGWAYEEFFAYLSLALLYDLVDQKKAVRISAHDLTFEVYVNGYWIPVESNLSQLRK